MNKAPGEVLLQVEDLNLKIRSEKKETPVLNGISFELHRRQHLGIVGASGAGKSMTMYAVTGLLPEKTVLQKGSIRYRNSDGSFTDITALDRKARRRLCSNRTAIILQDSINALNPYEKIYRQMEETVRLHHSLSAKDTEACIFDWMKRVGLEADRKFLDRYPHQFSGGMRQRIAIALALVSGAEILIADEPTTALDACNQMRFVELIRELCEDRKLAFLYISHNLGLISMLCDDVLVLEQGVITESGSVDEVFGNPQAESTRRLVEGTRELLYGI